MRWGECMKVKKILVSLVVATLLAFAGASASSMSQDTAMDVKPLSVQDPGAGGGGY
jgi:hypothetical protein